MAKLNQFAKNAGYNAGDNYAVKLVRIEDIKIDPELEGIFKIADNIRDDIAEKMKKIGFDKSQPLPVQKGTNILLDGHTRLAAAKKAGLEEIPIVEMQIEEREDMILYTYERQTLRRNLTSPEIMHAVELKQKIIPEGRNKKGEGRKNDGFAKKIGVSPATVYMAEAILRDGTEEDIKAIKNGEASIKATASRLAAPKKERKLRTEPMEKYQFLLRAVTILTEHDQQTAAGILVKEYLLTPFEREEFANLLSEDQRSLAALFLLPQKNPGTPPKADTQNGRAIR